MADGEVKTEDKKHINLVVRNQLGEDVQFKASTARCAQAVSGREAAKFNTCSTAGEAEHQV